MQLFCKYFWKYRKYKPLLMLCYVTTPFLCNCNKERFQKHTCNYIPNIVKVQCTFEISDRLQHGKERSYNHSQDV